MSISTSAEFSCPYCMAVNELEIDEENDINQQQILDCQICCSPIEITIAYGVHNRFNIVACTDSE